jgi:hypothetical protein
MPPDAMASAAAKIENTPAGNIPGLQNGQGDHDSLFEHVAWVYVFCREQLFRDDTERIIAALWPGRRPRAGTQLIELGCGPGFYSCRLAERFSEISVTGVDRSESQLRCARAEQLPLSTNQCSRTLVRRRSIRYRSCFAPVYYLARTRSGCRGDVPRPETRGALFHCRTAPCHSGIDSSFCHVATGWVKSISERLSRAL